MTLSISHVVCVGLHLADGHYDKEDEARELLAREIERHVMNNLQLPEGVTVYFV